MEHHGSNTGERVAGGELNGSLPTSAHLNVSANTGYAGGATRMGDEDEEQASPPSSSGSCNEFSGYVQQMQHGVGSGVSDEVEKNLDEPSIVLESENSAFQQRMWGCFQNCARAVAQVYMTSRSLQSLSSDSTQRVSQAPRSQRESPPSRTPSPQPQSGKQPQQVEESFKSAAQHATSLYKDSIETSRRLIDLAIKTGSNRRTKEVLAFVKSKKKRFIKRDELISFLVGIGGGSSSAKKDGLAGSSRGKNHIGGGSAGGAFDVGYSHLVHHVHSTGGGTGFAQCVSLSQQQSHQQTHHLPAGSPPQASQTCQQSSQQHNLRLVESPFPPFTPSLFTPRKHSSDFHTNASTPQRLVISNNTYEDNDPSSMLHLAVQQLFVAGAAGGNDFVHLAGVKRPAPDDGRGREDEDEGDCMMEDSVDGGSDCFKRMRF